MNRFLRLRYLVLGAITLSLGCAAYKQLSPDIDVSSAEGTYTQLLRNKKESFEVSKDSKYYIAFPAPDREGMYLVLSVPDKKKIGTSFTYQLVKAKKPGKRIGDETPYPDTVSVYPMPKGTFDTKGRPTQFVYWLIEKVPATMELKMKYRYVLQWRYKYEVRQAAVAATLAHNRVNRSVYQAIGTAGALEGFGFTIAIDTVGKHTAELEKAYQDLLAAEKIFPSNVVGTPDKTYQDFLAIKKDLQDEIAFQMDYKATLDLFYKEYVTRGKPFELLSYVDDFITYFAGKQRYPANVLQEAQTVLKKRLEEAGPAYDQRVGEKQDGTPLDADRYRLKFVARIPALFEAAGVSVPAAWATMTAFVGDFQAKSTAVAALRDSLAQIAAFVKGQTGMPTDALFGPVATRTDALTKLMPPQLGQEHGRYLTYPCGVALNRDIQTLGADLQKQITGYREAEALVPQLNQLKAQRDYSSMLGLLKQKLALTFLTDKYRDLDKMSVEEQAGAIRASLASGAWAKSEAALRKLNTDDNFIDGAVFMPLKAHAVDYLEDSLYDKVERATRTRVMKFLDEKVTQLENIDSLYTDSAFLPVHDITFSSGGKKQLLQRKEQLVADLAKMKENEFPAKAVKLLYDQFVKTPGDSGVWKARACVTHGKHYTGDDKEIKIRISECDPTLAKWITKPTEYRRVFALPISDNLKGKNKYMVRLNVNIPTDAQFPVYDVNIKLPKEVAQNAAATQWYDEIKLNKVLLKNEGRFSITAPSAANEYECQITPVQMNKDANNILEVTFTYPAFKPFNVSVMVQKPIIKKN
jgi:hypothetical protein